MRTPLVALSILSILAFSCKKDETSSELNQIEASYHMKPFNYTADEGDHLTGICFAFTQKAVESGLDTSELQKGDCPQSTSIKKIDNPEEEVTTEIMTTCQAYLSDNTPFAQLYVYDISYRTADFTQFETDAIKAEQLCVGLESFAKLLMSPQDTE